MDKSMNSLVLISTWTLYKKEGHRFLKVYHQTLLSPVISALTLLFIFALSIGDQVQKIENVPFDEFLASGLIIMSITQNAFANPSSSLLMSKITGTIIDYIIPPISTNSFIIAYVLGGVTRGIAVGIMVALALSYFVDMHVYSYSYLILFSLLSTLLLSILGTIGGILTNSFDQLAAITTYVITPLSLLSGTFYSVKDLPHSLEIINQFNPFFYVIDSFRYSMIGISDSSIPFTTVFLSISILLCYVCLYFMIKTGYRIKN
jgi:ABC-2 type transport system permease protein